MRDQLARALSRSAIEPGKAVPVPIDYALWKIGIEMGVPAWVLEGYPLDEPPIEWLIRSLEFSRMEASVTVQRSSSHG